MKYIFAVRAIIIFSASIICSGELSAGVFKCKDSSGSITYQQTPCSADAQQHDVRVWKGPGEADVAAARARQAAIEEADSFARVRQAQDEDKRELDSEDKVDTENTITVAEDSVLSEGCPAGQIALNASRHDPSRGFSKGKGYVPLQCVGASRRKRDAAAARTGPGYTEPRRFQDQYGDWYSQPPGSNFATKEKSGKQCVVNGATVLNCD